MHSCYPSYLSYDDILLFFVLAGFCCCLVSEMKSQCCQFFVFVLIMFWLWEGLSFMCVDCLGLIFGGSWI